MGTYSARVAGLTMDHGRARAAAGLYEGAAVRLEPEPDNPHDSNAIAVYAGPAKIGYIARDNAAWMARAMRDGTAIRAIVRYAPISDGEAEAVFLTILTGADADQPLDIAPTRPREIVMPPYTARSAPKRRRPWLWLVPIIAALAIGLATKARPQPAATPAHHAD